MRSKIQVIFKHSSRFQSKVASRTRLISEKEVSSRRRSLQEIQAFPASFAGGRSPQDPDDGVGRLGNMFSLSPKPGRSLNRARNIMIKVKINGHEQSWDGDPQLPLLWFLRDEIGLTGAKFGCGQALCGACTVMVDGQAVRSCITAVSDAEGREVTTIEGLHPTGDHVVQKAWRQVNVPQCGYCQAGQIMQAAALLHENPKPSHDQIREAMAGNICRCGCYQRIEAAVQLASTGV
jgi:isoquinoline 1-oxidoreductase alpha subunit